MTRNEADQVRESFQIRDGLFLLGSFEQGVTVYSQQVRALNLAWSLAMGATKPRRRIAVIGGGIAGLTFAAAMLAADPDSEVYLLERRADLCPLQQGSDSRWLHPRIYDWPAHDTRRPSAGLPVLNWSEGRASDVADRILEEFFTLIKSAPNRIRIFLNVEYAKVEPSRNAIQWIGQESESAGSCWAVRKTTGTEEMFDAIVVATGFGLEKQEPQYPTVSYWRNDTLAQPVLDSRARKYVVSGCGDGGLIDLCRIRIARFRQDRIVYDIFDDVEVWEDKLRSWSHECGRGTETFAALSSRQADLEPILKRLEARLRVDSSALLHIRSDLGKASIDQAFTGKASFLNKLLVFMLYRLGAFAPVFGDLEQIVQSHDLHRHHVVCRHGCDPLGNVLNIFRDPAAIESELVRLHAAAGQMAVPLWPLGFFRYEQSW